MKVKLTLFLKEVVALETRAEAIDGLAGLADPKSDGVENSAQGSHSAVASGSGSGDGGGAIAICFLTHRSSLFFSELSHPISEITSRFTLILLLFYIKPECFFLRVYLIIKIKKKKPFP